MSEVSSRRHGLLADRDESHTLWDAARTHLKSVEQRYHELDLRASQGRMERDVLVQRVRDDYDIDLSRLEDAPVESEDEQR